MKIDQSLNLVSTVEREGFPLYVYVTPFPYEVIEQYYGILGQTFSRFFGSCFLDLFRFRRR